MFKRISNDDLKLIGMDPKWSRPEWMICTVLPVSPPAVRPSVRQDNNQRSDDDLTYKLIDIFKTNSKLKDVIQSDKPQKTIDIYNIQGNKIDNIFNGFLNKGNHSFNWNASNHATGLYVIKLVQGNNVLTQKIMLIK